MFVCYTYLETLCGICNSVRMALSSLIITIFLNCCHWDNLLRYGRT